MHKIIKNFFNFISLSFILIVSHEVVASSQFEPDWSEGATINEPRSNLYNLNDSDLKLTIKNGKIHTLDYPVEVTGILAPYEPLRKILEDKTQDNILTQFVHYVLNKVFKMDEVDDLDNWLGLHPYPKENEVGIYSIPYPDGVKPTYRMGATFINRFDAKGLTFSCAACHSSNLFGKSVLGMTNRFPQANNYFIAGKMVTSHVSASIFQTLSGASEQEVKMYQQLRDAMPFVKAKSPQTMGLDTSLSIVAMSLARRENDEYATKDLEVAKHPRYEPLEKMVSDSKPAVWWNVKYKNRWLSDGSVVSGNPIYTNILWNEISRGADLRVLEKWLDENPRIIKELASAVFATEAPIFTDFFAAEKFDIHAAKRGEKIFNQMCTKCHGKYEKNWSLANAQKMPIIEQLKTFKVTYHKQTLVKDVGTDPNRYLGIKSLEALNDLAISKKNGVIIKTQKGYVPPPLVGIWARWPYFHNNSIPSLCALFTRPDLRPKSYYARSAIDKENDFDQDCNGYPMKEMSRSEQYKRRKYLYDTTKSGMHNSGHYEKLFIKDGKEVLSSDQKKDLIRFLQTL